MSAHSHLPVVFPIVAAAIFLIIGLRVESMAGRFMVFWFHRQDYRPGLLIKGYKWLLIVFSALLLTGALVDFIRNRF